RLEGGKEDVLLAREVGEDRARRDAGDLGDVRQRGRVVPALDEQLDAGPREGLARLALLPLSQAGGRFGHGLSVAGICTERKFALSESSVLAFLHGWKNFHE